MIIIRQLYFFLCQVLQNQKDNILKDYKPSLTLLILREIFLDTSLRMPKEVSATTEDKLVLLIALFSITISVFLFILPVIYHHSQYPHQDYNKMRQRSHRFILFGLVPLFVTLYLGLETAISSNINSIYSYIKVELYFLSLVILFRR